MSDQEATDLERRQKRVKDLLTIRMEQMHRYHDHKETMAHAALLVMLGLTGWVITLDNPPEWMTNHVSPASPETSDTSIFGILLVAIWLILHVYIRQQQRWGRLAAIYVRSILVVLRQWANIPPTNAGLRAHKSEDSPKRKRLRRALLRVLDLVWPIHRARVISDECLDDYPEFLVTKLTDSTHPPQHVKTERIVCVASLLMLILILVRIVAFNDAAVDPPPPNALVPPA